MTATAIGSATLHLGHCEGVLPSLPLDAAIVSDPPYGIGYRRAQGGAVVCPGGGTVKRPKWTAIANDDRPFDPSHLLGFARVALFGGNHFAARLPEGGSLHAWDKTGGGRGPKDAFSDVEFAWVNAPGKSRIFRYLWKGICQDGEKGQKRSHPTQKPVAVMRWLIETFTERGQTIVDPYMGSGACALAALQLGRPFVGIECDPGYHASAVERLTRAMDARAAA